ncbi:MAG: ribonuclease R [Candidatus Magnetoovum sp. WYHC-5]|nr:ribonuclease R [Candidatus Magnetoovum sp. WYHC-5]
MVDKEELLQYIKTRKKPLSFKELSMRFCSNKGEAKIIKKYLRALVKEGALRRTQKGQFGQTEEKEQITGYFEAHKGGYGFVISEKPSMKDIYVSLRKTMGAMNNDRVVALIENETKRDGRIVKIIERAHKRVVGKIVKKGNTLFLQPKLKTIPFDIVVHGKNALKVSDGDTVIGEIEVYQEGKHPSFGKIVKKVKPPSDPESEINQIIEEFNLPKRFSPSLVAQIHEIPHEIPEDIISTRKDLRTLKTVTIDGESAKDFDDAISIRKVESGYKLYVHIADVGFYVPWESPIDIEARKRGTSVYFPNKVLPMLPKVLSEDLCSLKHGVDRLTITVEMDFDSNGTVQHASFYRSVINTNARMTYTKVKNILIDNDEVLKKKYKSLVPDFELMSELCLLIKQKKELRGSLDFDLPEPEILIDIQGNLEGIVKAQRNFAHRIIEEFMIAANESVAEFMAKTNIPCLYRVHEEPEQRKIDDMANVLFTAGIWKKRKPKPSDFPALIKKARSTPYEEMVNYIILRSLKQAKYSPINVGHFGLASPCYCHFTSPIRRYPDLVVHRILCDVLEDRNKFENQQIKLLETILPDIAFHSSRRERIADEAENTAVDALRTWFMKDKIGSVFNATVVRVSNYGLKIRLNDYYIEGHIPIENMTDDYYDFNDTELTLKGRRFQRKYTIGDSIQVKAYGINQEEREVLFAIILNIPK